MSIRSSACIWLLVMMFTSTPSPSTTGRNLMLWFLKSSTTVSKPSETVTFLAFLV